MRLDKLRELTCRFYNITEERFLSGSKDQEVVMPQHFFRVFSNVDLKYKLKDVAIAANCDHSTVSSSKRTILEDGVFASEYAEYRMFIGLNTPSGEEVVVDDSGIERVTNDAFDERFYKHPKRLNRRTNNEYFPAFHFVTKLGSPEPIGLTRWRQDKGHFADYILERSSLIGSYVHDSIDLMIKSDITVLHDDIHRDFPNAKEAQRVKECFLGFMNFVRDEEPIFIASERMECAEDFGFTLDNQVRLKSDKYKHLFVSDWKTSKVANEDHKMQVEVMRRVTESEKAMVIILGNSTKKKYTCTTIKSTEQDYLWNRFQTIKETAYVEMFRRGTIKPREDNMPHVFGLRELTFKRRL